MGERRLTDPHRLNTRTLRLTERSPAWFHVKHLPAEVGEHLWRHYSAQVAVEFPSPKTQGGWELRALGWVGTIPLPSGLMLHIAPKVEISNLFRMLEYAYHLRSVRFLDDLIHCEDLPEVYEQLALILARKVLERSRKGFHRAFVSQRSDGHCVRGRIELNDLARRPWAVPPRCQIQRSTVDVEDNQILAWTLYTIAHSGLCGPRSHTVVGRAWRTLRNAVTLKPFSPADCVQRSYHRMNQDYAPLHALCRFFLAHSGPQHERGDHPTLPFLVHMDRLFEQFVAAWFSTHLPEHLAIRAQQRVDVDRRTHVYFNIDLVLYDLGTGQVLGVLDTKYKDAERPSSEDLAQLVAYAQSLSCRRAFLIYPLAFEQPFDIHVGDVRIQRLAFPLSGDLDHNGHRMLASLLESM
ncbi:MAG: restriction endonuclease [Myxococcales bacterium]|nr:restriction endonuclease [Myxococcales bacterium]